MGPVRNIIAGVKQRLRDMLRPSCGVARVFFNISTDAFLFGEQLQHVGVTQKIVLRHSAVCPRVSMSRCEASASYSISVLVVGVAGDDFFCCSLGFSKRGNDRSIPMRFQQAGACSAKPRRFVFAPACRGET